MWVQRKTQDNPPIQLRRALVSNSGSIGGPVGRKKCSRSTEWESRGDIGQCRASAYGSWAARQTSPAAATPCICFLLRFVGCEKKLLHLYSPKQTNAPPRLREPQYTCCMSVGSSESGSSTQSGCCVNASWESSGFVCARISHQK